MGHVQSTLNQKDCKPQSFKATAKHRHIFQPCVVDLWLWPTMDLGRFWLGYIRMLGHPQMSAHHSNLEGLLQIDIKPFFVEMLGHGLIPGTLGMYCGNRHLVNRKCPTSFDLDVVPLGHHAKTHPHTCMSVHSPVRRDTPTSTQIVQELFYLSVPDTGHNYMYQIKWL